MKSALFRHVIFQCLILGAPVAAFAQPSVSVDVYADNYDSSVPGESVASVDVFYDQLLPYGVWAEEPQFGRVFIPDRPQFVPYTEGHWQYTNVGFVWISTAPFDWATAHYGRWAYSRAHSRWVWLPDTVWGPSWVEWRQSGAYFGWAPLAPQIAIEIGYEQPVESWRYCNASHILDVNVTRYYEPPRQVVVYQRDSRRLDHYANIGGARVVVGPPRAVLHEHHVDVRPTRIVEARVTGRLTTTEARAVTKRAEDRRESNEQLNRKRIDANPALRQHVIAARATPAAKPEVRPPVTTKPEVKQPPARPEVKQPPARPEVKQPPARPEVKQPPARPEAKQPRAKPEPRPEVKQPPARPEPRPEAKQPPARPEAKPQPKQEQPKSPATREPPKRANPPARDKKPNES